MAPVTRYLQMGWQPHVGTGTVQFWWKDGTFLYQAFTNATVSSCIAVSCIG